MALELAHEHAVILIRQTAFERSGITRSAIDERYNLTADEFRVEEGLVVLGPLPSADIVPQLIDDLEQSGLVYFDDFFELTGNWPEWLTLYARSVKTGRI
jgi:hypothetical protein